MRFVNDLPVIQGASDCMDSAFFAGMLATFDYNCFDRNLCSSYLMGAGPVRHPIEIPANNPKNFSRDQLVPLASGLKGSNYSQALLNFIKKLNWYAPNTEEDVVGSIKRFPDGPDWLSPSVRNHLRICAGEKPSLVGKLNLIIDILWASYVDRSHEVNQLICMCKIAGPFYIKLLKFFKKDLEHNIRDYWSQWRQEPEFAEHLIRSLK